TAPTPSTIVTSGPSATRKWLGGLARLLISALSGAAPASLSVVRIEQPSTRHFTTRAVTSGQLVIVSPVSFSWRSQEMELQKPQRQRWFWRFTKAPKLVACYPLPRR